MAWKGRRAPNRVSGSPWADADNHIHAADFGAGGRHRQAGHPQIFAGYVLQFAGHFAEEVMMVGNVSIEIRSAGLDDDFVQEPRIGKLMKRVVDGRERHPDAGRQRFAVQLLGRDVALPAFEQEPCQGDTLACGPQICRTQAMQGK